MNSSLRTALLFAPIAVAHAQQQPPRRPAQRADDLTFRFMGPAVGNRIASAAGVPGDPNTYYAGAASGGVWKSTDGGRALGRRSSTSEPVQAIGALAVAPSDPNIVWAGTGEAWAIRDAT